MSEASNENEANNETTKKIILAKINWLWRLILTLISIAGTYFLIAAHYLAAVRLAHFLGDVSYLPPSVTRFTGIIFRPGEAEAGAQILYLIVWLIFVCAALLGMFLAARFVIKSFINLLIDDRSYGAAIWNCFCSGFICLTPLLSLALLTLLTMPLEGARPAAESPSMMQVGEATPFADFLMTMTQATSLIALVCLLVVIVCVIVYFLTKILPDHPLFTLASFFIGTWLAVPLVYVLVYYSNIGFEFLKAKTGGAYLTHFIVFGIYAVLSAAPILPFYLGDRQKPKGDLAEKLKEFKQKKRRRNQGIQAV